MTSQITASNDRLGTITWTLPEAMQTQLLTLDPNLRQLITSNMEEIMLKFAGMAGGAVFVPLAPRLKGGLDIDEAFSVINAYMQLAVEQLISRAK